MAEDFKTSIMSYTPDVWDSGAEFICIQMMGADLMSTIYRMKGVNDLICSPGVLIDARCDTKEKLIAILTKPDKGIQSIVDYPLTSSSHLKLEYQVGMRYWLDGLKHYTKQKTMERKILANFDPNGPKLPILVSVAMGDFLKPVVALEAWKKPYQHPPDADLDAIYSEMPHMLMIVGVSTKKKGKMDKKKIPYLLVKNCHGLDWGNKGFSKMVFEMAAAILVPILKDKNMACVPKQHR